MGWTSYHATHYKNGKVDRIAEIKHCLEFGNSGKYRVLKASLVGSTVYTAIEYQNEEETRVFASVFLTSTDSKDYFNFSYKDMDETCGPYAYDCPASILKLLTPTTSEYANEWRKKCWENIEAKRNQRKNPQALSNLPLGTIIEMNYWEEGIPTIRLQKIKHGAYKNPIWIKDDYSFKVRPKLIESQGYTVLS